MWIGFERAGPLLASRQKLLKTRPSALRIGFHLERKNSRTPIESLD